MDDTNVVLRRTLGLEIAGNGNVLLCEETDCYTIAYSGIQKGCCLFRAQIFRTFLKSVIDVVREGVEGARYEPTLSP